MNLCISLYCRVDKLLVVTKKICDYIKSYPETVSFQIISSYYSIQTPDYKLDKMIIDYIKKRISTFSIKLILLNYDYGVCHNTLKCDAKDTIYFFSNYYIPDVSEVDKIISYYSFDSNNNKILTQSKDNSYSIPLGNTIYYCIISSNLKNIRLFLNHTYNKYYETLFNFDTWFSYYCYVNNLALIENKLHVTLLHEPFSIDNIYTNDINRQINILKHMENYTILNNSDYVKLDTNIVYQPKELLSVSFHNNVNTDTRFPKFIVADNFYSNPLSLYGHALTCAYTFNEMHKCYTYNLDICNLHEYLANKLSLFLNITSPNIVNIHSTTFAYNTTKQLYKPHKIHWLAICILNPHSLIDAGVHFYKYEQNNKYFDTKKEDYYLDDMTTEDNGMAMNSTNETNATSDTSDTSEHTTESGDYYYLY